MKTAIKEQLRFLKDEATQRGEAITKFRKTLVSNYDSYVIANGLDELRDLNIFILECSYSNRRLVKLIDEVLDLENKAMNKLDMNTLVTENLKCFNEFQSLKIAMSTIRTATKKPTLNSLKINTNTKYNLGTTNIA